MTTIAYRDGIMAADSGAWHGDAATSWARKIARGPDGTLYGVSGYADEADPFLKWVDGGCCGEAPKAGAEPEGRSTFVVLSVKPGGPVELITARGVESYPAPYFSIGAGNVGAFCAMYCGASARQAVDAVKEHGGGAHGPVQWLAHEG